MMQAVFAGVVCGYGLAIAWTWLVMVLLARSRYTVSFLQKALPPEVPSAFLLVPVSLFAFLGLTALGMVWGALYRYVATEAPGGGLGSPNLAFTLLFVLIPAAAALVFIGVYRRRVPGWITVSLVLTFVVAFGWIMPFLAER